MGNRWFQPSKLGGKEGKPPKEYHISRLLDKDEDIKQVHVENAVITGPAVVRFHPSTYTGNCAWLFPENMDDLFYEIDLDRETVGVISVFQSTFRNVMFKNIGIAAPKQEIGVWIEYLSTHAVDMNNSPVDDEFDNRYEPDPENPQDRS